MRPVNLLPPRYRRARATGERSGIGYAVIGTLGVLLVMLLVYVLTNNSINDANDKTAKATAEQQVAQARVGQLQAYGNFAALKQAREQAVEGVALVRFDYERLMRETALVLPHDAYLTSFAAGGGGGSSSAPTAGVSATGPAVTVAGCAPSHQGVATTIVRLRKLHNVVNVDLGSSTKQSSSAAGTTSACPTSFTATLAFQAETAPTAPAAVPARLGGGQ